MSDGLPERKHYGKIDLGARCHPLPQGNTTTYSLGKTYDHRFKHCYHRR